MKEFDLLEHQKSDDYNNLHLCWPENHKHLRDSVDPVLLDPLSLNLSISQRHLENNTILQRKSGRQFLDGLTERTQLNQFYIDFEHNLPSA